MAKILKARSLWRSHSIKKVSAIAEALEPRLLFSADCAPLGLGITNEGHLANTASASNAALEQLNVAVAGDQTPNAVASAPSQLFVVDLRIVDANVLLAGLNQQQAEAHGRGEQFEILTLNANDDGIAKIGQALAAQANVSGLHLLGHGEEGKMLLGSSWINESSMRSRASDYSQWSIGLAEQADVLIYGCDFAVGESGKRSVQAIAQLTGADVAASTDATANPTRAGNWLLEYQAGLIETNTQSVAAAAVQWQGRLATFSVTNTADSGAGSLRAAITAANANAGTDVITFNLASSGPSTINLLSELPAISDTVVIDGTTQAGFSSQPLIELNGLSAGPSDGIKLAAGSDGSVIRGLIINRFDGFGIVLISNNNVIRGNYVGTNFDGSVALSNSSHGIVINNSFGNSIGGSTALDRNVSSGNGGAGIYLLGASSTANSILGNYVGTTASGSAGLGNSNEGIVVLFGSYNLIGGFNAGEGNVVSGNLGNGIALYQASNDIIRGNIIGLNAAGTAGIANAQSGISLNLSPSERIGGSGFGEGNIISGNQQSGIHFKNSNDLVIRGNLIGRNADNTATVGNIGAGILGENNSTNALVGGTNASEANIIVGNNVGIALGANHIGNNSFLGNSVYGNVTIGIDLLWNGLTQNDAGDGDFGPNALQNYPQLYSANTTGGVTLITGEINTTANTTYRIEFFSSPSGDVTGYGEGQTYLGSATVTTNAAGRGSINASLAGVNVANGSSISSTATVDLGGGVFGATSEFSQNVVSTLGTPGVTVTPTSPLVTTETGGTASFTVVLTGAPSADVTVSLSVSDATEGSLAVAGLVFTPLNWNVAQTVVVSGVNDFIVDGAIGYNVITSALLSADAAFNGIVVADVALINSDDDSHNDIVVDTTSDIDDADTSSVATLYANRGADGYISLREAFKAANNTPNSNGVSDHITFNIAQPLAGGRHTILVSTNLPALSDAVSIDGVSGLGFVAVPIIRIQGTGAADRGLVLGVGSSGSKIDGLMITGFSAIGLQIQSHSNDLFRNFIGTDGAVANANGTGIFIEGSLNTIGLANFRNLVSGNLTNGVHLASGASSNVVSGNIIGTNAAGSAGIANGANGVRIDAGAANNRVGIAVFGGGNQISGNLDNGLQVSGGGTFIQNNLVGLSADGQSAISNGLQGILLTNGASVNIIGGIGGLDRNVVSGNGRHGINLSGPSTNNNVIVGNTIGLTADLSNRLGNTWSGISIDGGTYNNRIGGVSLGEGNIIAGGTGNGVTLSFTTTVDNKIQGNLIGTNGLGATNLGNLGAGVEAVSNAGSNLVGGTVAGAGNLIVYNGLQGVSVTSGNAVAILGNVISNNSGLGIDLRDDGLTLNDVLAGDPDVGPNGLQNYPVILSSNTVAGNTTITGELNSNSSTAYRVEFFASLSSDASGHGQADRYLGFVNVSTDASGKVAFSRTLIGVSVPTGSWVTATATVDVGSGIYGSTSEYAQNVATTGGTPGITINQPLVPVTTEAGGTATFSVVLNAAPTADVVINLSVSDPTEGSIAVSSLTFTSVNWNVAQTVTVTGVNDFLLDGAVSYSVITSGIVSNDAAYNGLAVADVALTTSDDDTFNTVVVNTTSDAADGDVSSIAALYANRGADGKISLREAILAANSTVNPVGTVDHINFNILDPLVAGSHTINVVTALPSISEGIYIDGYTQPLTTQNSLSVGSNAQLLIEIKGDLVVNSNGINLAAGSDNSTIRGLMINGFLGNGSPAGHAVFISSNNNFFQGNYLGVRQDGAVASNWTGLVIGSGAVNNLIGGNLPADRNVISGNTGVGISVYGAGNINTKIQGNSIGVGIDGVTARPNFSAGIDVWGAATAAFIGGTQLAQGNHIQSNTGNGIHVRAGSSAVILGNLIDSNSALGIDLNNDGITANDAGDGDTGANDQQNYPVLTSATSSAAGTTVLGTFNSTANSTFRIEFFSSPLGDASGHGEARNFLGFSSVTTDATGNASLAAFFAGVTVPLGAVVSATATQDLGGGIYRSTSELALNVVVSAPATGVISGRVVDDPESDGNISSSAGLAARVYLFKDDGDGVMNAADLLIGAANTAANGVYTFDGLAAATYWTVVDSRSIQATFNGTFDATSTWWEQTYGSVGSKSFNGTFNYTFSGGELLGGARRDASDGFTGSASSLADAEHATRTILSAAAIVANVDFAFSSSAIVTTLDGDDDVATPRSKQGSLRQFIDNSSALAGVHTSDFRLVTTDPNYDAVRGVWRLTINQSLPTLSDGGILDAYSQGVFGGDTNPGTYLPPADPLRQFAATPISRPEVELAGAGTAAAGTGINQTGIAGAIRGLSIYGFSTGIATDATGTIIGSNFLGLTASAADPVNQRLQNGIRAVAADNAKISFNAIAYTQYSGIVIVGGSNLLISRNNITNTGLAGVQDDGINVSGINTGLNIVNNSILFSNGRAIDLGNASAAFVTNNFIADSGLGGVERNGIFVWSNSRSVTIEANTITRSQLAIQVTGDGSSNVHTIGGVNRGNILVGNENSAIRLDRTNGVKIQGNNIGVTSALAPLPNAGTGIANVNLSINTLIGGLNAGEGNIVASSVFSAGITSVTGNGATIVGNSIYSNAAIGITLGTNPNAPAPNDLNDADLIAGNGPQNYPVITSVQASGATSQITGTLNSRAGRVYRIEAFRNPSSLIETNGYSEGAQFLGAFNVSTSAFGVANFSQSLATATQVGDKITLIATEDFGSGLGSSSEFSLAATVTAAVPGVTVTVPSGTLTTESGGSVQLNIVLNTAPTSNVTINFSVSNSSEGRLSYNSMTFTALNWNLPQVVTLSGVDDNFIDGNIGYSVNFAPAGSADPAYAGIATASFLTSNLDNDTFNTLVVDTTADALGGDTSSIAALYANKGADGKISLREAIIAANNTPNGVGGPDRIHFNIADPLVGGLHTISVTSSLPTFDTPIILDGSTEPDFTGTPVVVISGISAGTNANGINIGSGANFSEVRSVRIDSFSNLAFSVSSVPNVTIGGIGYGNEVTRNKGGINVDPGSNNVRIIGNAFGTNLAGTLSLGNFDTNIRLLGGNGALIGGIGVGAGNLIANAQTGIGVEILSSSTGNSILGNAIYNNFLQGIDIGSFGVQANDVGDGDAGANDLQNYPVLSSVVSAAGNTTIVGSFNSNANRNYRIEFYSSATGDATGHGEGRTFLGFASVTTDASGNANFSPTFNGLSLANGTAISATATVDLGAGNYGSSSEFAQNISAVGAPTGVSISAPTSATTSEAGATSQFSVVLNTQPIANVTINLSVSNSIEASLSVTSLVFTAANWNIAQLVTVTGVNDLFVDGNSAYTVVTSNTVSGDAAYNDLAVGDIALTNLDNDTFNTLVVDTVADTVDGSDISSIAALYANKGADGKISLREAIIAANNTLNGTQRDSILFNIADPLINSTHTINVLSPLPTITDAVLIDGASEPDFGLTHVVELRGDNAGALAAGLVLTASDSRINGLTINRFDGNGLSVLGNNNQLSNNFIGVSSDGVSARGNRGNGIFLLNASNTTIGGTSASLGNVISGNLANGIEIRDSSGSLIESNLVGLDALGSTALGNGTSGIYLEGANTTTTTIGGGAGRENTVGGNVLSGLAFETNVSGVVVTRNFIGTNRVGAVSVGNGDWGVFTRASNVNISGNSIANNQLGGFYVSGFETSISSNSIASEAKGVVVAGSATGVTIVNNVMDGVAMLIDLGNDGVTANDANDVDVGPNNLMNTAVLSSVGNDGAGQIRVAGSFNGQANRTLSVAVYEHGLTGTTQHSAFVGSFILTTDAGGNASFNQAFFGSYPVNTIFSTTVTDITNPLGRTTSEHSNAVAAAATGVVVTPNSGLVVTEAGTSAAVSIVLSTAPTADVTVNFSLSVNGEISLSSTSFTFTASNWNVAQILVVTGLQDFVADGDTLVTILTSNAVSSDTAYSGMAVADITVTNQAIPNTAPMITAPTSFTATEDTIANLGGIRSGISVSDFDAFNNQIDVTLTVSNGVYSLGATTGLIFSAGDGSADVSMTFRGTVAEINAAIDNLIFTPTANYAGIANLSLFVNDLGNTGSGGALGASTSIPINVTAVNDLATFTGSAAGNLNEGASLKITTAMLQLADIDNPTSDLIYTVTAQTTDGELRLNGTTLKLGDSFTQADIDNQLVDYVHFSGENPAASITLGLSERFGGTLPDVTLNLAVAPVNDAPVITGITGETIPEITTLGAVVGQVLATDADDNVGTVFSLVDDDNATFRIDAITGVITVLNPLALDFETAAQHSIRVKVADLTGASAERIFQIRLMDVTEFVPVGDPPKPGDLTPTTPPPTPPSTVLPAEATPPSVQGTTTGNTSDSSASLTPQITNLSAGLGSSPAGADGVRGSVFGTGKARQLDKDSEVWIDPSQEQKILAQKDLKRKLINSLDAEALDVINEVKRRRSINSDALDLLFSSRKNVGTLVAPPMVLLGEFKLPAAAQVGIIDDGAIVESAAKQRFNVVIDSVQIGGVVMSVGVVAWVARTGGLLAALISAMPAWKGLDPLLVLSPAKAKAPDGFDEFSDTDLREDEEAVQAVLF